MRLTTNKLALVIRWNIYSSSKVTEGAWVRGAGATGRSGGDAGVSGRLTGHCWGSRPVSEATRPAEL